MVCHRRGFFQRADVFEISGDPGCPETVVAELGFDPGRRGAPPAGLNRDLRLRAAIEWRKIGLIAIAGSIGAA
jgi:hypothetical protein